jgi:hypothetical protein
MEVGGAAQATIINFDDQGLSGPSTPSGVSPVVINAGGDTVTFSNGQILTNETFLPADETSVYYNSSFTPGSTGAAMTVTPQPSAFPATVMAGFR